MKKICFTGGGSSGHVTPNLAIIEELKKNDVSIFYIGSENGIEKELIQKENITYFAIKSGKLRRYFSLENFIDPFKIIMGFIQAYFILRKQKPDVVFSKGGFVTFPVAIAAKLNHIPLIVHESDFVPGLANKLAFPFADKICVTFDATKKNIKYKNKIITTGAPIREDFFIGNKERALNKFSLDPTKKTLLIICGGLGSIIINETIFKIAEELSRNYNIIHITGKGKINQFHSNIKNYIQIEYLYDDIFDVMALADLVISRAGSNTLYELILLKKKHILIPLSKNASRGDQIDNAKYFEEKGLSYVIPQEDLTPEKLIQTIEDVYAHNTEYQNKLNEYVCPNGTREIVELLKAI